MKFKAFLSCLFLAANLAAQAPDDEALSLMIGKVIIVRTAGGGEFQGVLFSVGEDRIELLTGEGQILGIAREALLGVEARDFGRDQAEYFQDSAANRLILMPTGFGMEPGEFHIAAQEIIVITGSYGISEHFSVWGGVSIPGAVVNLRWSTPLGTVTALSLGSFVGATWIDPIGVLLPYALASFGHPNRNVTVAAGVPLSWSADRALRPLGLLGAIGGKIIVSATASIVTENWILAYSDGWTWSEFSMFFAPAVVFRIAGPRISWDIGAVVPLQLAWQGAGYALGGMGGGTVIPLPLLSLTYRID